MITGCKDIRSVLRTPIQRYYDAGVICMRTFNVCIGSDIYTVGELLRVYNEGGLPKIRNCGKYTISELSKILEPIDKTYGMQIVNKLDQYEDMPEPIKAVIVSNYRRPLMKFSLDCIKRFYATFKDPCSFYNFFCLDQKNLDERFVSIDSMELKHYCYQLLSEIHSELRNEYLIGTLTYELVVVARAVLWFCDDQFAEELETADPVLKYRRKALLEDFEFRTSMLSRYAKRVQHCLIPSYSRAVGLLLLSEKEVVKLMEEFRTMGMTYRELFNLLDGLNDALFYYERNEGTEIHKDIIASKYRYLSDEQTTFVAEFVHQNGYYPMFFLLREYLKKSGERSHYIFSKATGINGGNPMSLADIGKEIECTRERVRQLMATAPKDLFKDQGWQHYHLGNTLVIAEDDALYKDVVEHEKVDISFESFALVCTSGFPLKVIKENDIRFLINDRLSSQIIGKVCREVEKESKRIKPEAYIMRFDELLKDVPCDKIDDYKKVLPVIIAKSMRYYVNEEGNIVFPPTGVDVIYELSGILREKGRPMTLKEMLSALKQKCPEVSYKKPQQIKDKVLRSGIIVPIGRSGRYSLTEWSHVYRGSIRDLVAKILRKSAAPVHIDEIMEKVLQVNPYTNKRSVSSSISNDKDRFVLFGDGYYGLKRKRYKTQRI